MISTRYRRTWCNERWRFLLVATICVLLAGLLVTRVAVAESMRAEIEQDWIRQAEHWMAGRPVPPTTQSDAAGAVDGVKDGKYAFHTGAEPNPWWQVDLGASRLISRLVVFNRLDYAPGLHNADNLGVLVSDDAKEWTVCYENRGKHFGGVTGAPPLEVRLDKPISVRFIRLQVRSQKPILFHLDEVEVFGPNQPEKNLAVGCLADQSSLSPWSTNKLPVERTVSLLELAQKFLKQGQLLAPSADHDLLDQVIAIHQRRCDACHTPIDISRADWIDLRSPAKSRFLTAPLARSAGGTQRCSQAVYEDSNDRDYVALLALLEHSVQKAWQQPRRDLKSLK